MSPRAAWRLESIGYLSVYHYVNGKADWLAAGLPTARASPPPARVAGAMDISVPTCGPDELVGDVMARIGTGRGALCVVLNDRRVVLGRLRLDRLDHKDNGRAEDVMDPGPVTVRADADLARTTDRMRDRGVPTLIVSTPDGVLLGVVHAEPKQ
jgi:hypothetical protein